MLANREKLLKLATKREWMIVGAALVTTLVIGLGMQFGVRLGPRPQTLQEVLAEVRKSGNVGNYEFTTTKLHPRGPDLPCINMTMIGDYAGPGWSVITVTDITKDADYAQKEFDSLTKKPWRSVRVIDPVSHIYAAKTDRFMIVGWGRDTVYAVLSHID